MASHLQVILKEDVAHLGRAGELVKVKPGYARNYLLPRELAVAATRSNIRQIEHEKRLAAARTEKQRNIAEGYAAQVEGLTVEIPMPAGEGDRLFGSVTTRDIADALTRHGIELDRKKLVIDDSIKTLGEHPITIKLGYEVTASFRVIVSRA